MGNAAPVMENEIITIIVAGVPMKVRAARVEPEVRVHWQAIDNDENGAIPYETWQRARDAQAAIAKHNLHHGQRPAIVNPDAVDIGIDEVTRLGQLIRKLGTLTRSYGYIRAYSRQYSSPYLKICADDLERARALIMEETGVEPEKLP